MNGVFLLTNILLAVFVIVLLVVAGGLFLYKNKIVSSKPLLLIIGVIFFNQIFLILTVLGLFFLFTSQFAAIFGHNFSYAYEINYCLNAPASQELSSTLGDCIGVNDYSKIDFLNGITLLTIGVVLLVASFVGLFVFSKKYNHQRLYSIFILVEMSIIIVLTLVSFVLALYNIYDYIFYVKDNLYLATGYPGKLLALACSFFVFCLIFVFMFLIDRKRDVSSKKQRLTESLEAKEEIAQTIRNEE